MQMFRSWLLQPARPMQIGVPDKSPGVERARKELRELRILPRARADPPPHIL